MRALAVYIMRGQLQAISTVAVFAVLALVAMPVSWPISYLSAAGVGLVTLSQGPVEGGKTLLGASVILAIIGMLIMGDPALAMAFAVSLWLPAWALASVLLKSRSLVLPIQVLLIFALSAVALMYVAMGEPALWWYNHIVGEVLPTLEKANIVIESGPEFKQRLANATRLMTGVLVMITAWGILAGLLIARWWQAVLYRPGAFGDEFRGLRLGKVMAIVTVLVVILASAGKGLMAELAGNMLLVLLGLLVLQGLAIAHSLVARFKANHVWLVMLYMLLVIMLPYMLVMIAMTGLIDNWVDIRQRFQARA